MSSATRIHETYANLNKKDYSWLFLDIILANKSSNFQPPPDKWDRFIKAYYSSPNRKKTAQKYHIRPVNSSSGKFSKICAPAAPAYAKFGKDFA